MSDSERDAWLREALRHAPDADVAPPRDLSETILAQARAATRAGGRPARAAGRHPLVALWDWLARPPVAAGFATVMAATLVGLMWWDRPMDETLPRRPEAAAVPAPPVDVGAAATAERSAGATTERSAAATAAAPEAKTLPPTAAAPAPRNVDAVSPAPQPSRRQRADDKMLHDDKTANAANVPAAAAAPPPPAIAPAEDAKERQRKLEPAANEATRAERAAAKPAPFPRDDDARARLSASPAKKTDSEAKAGNAKDAAADALAPREAPLAKAAPAAPAEGERSAPPMAFGRERANELARTSPTSAVDEEAAKRRPSAGARSQATPATAATSPAPAAAPAAPPALRGSVSGEVRERQAGALSSPAAAQAQSDLASPQREGAGASPLAAIVGAIASDPARWSRTTASGSVVALEPGWRDWLAQLDAAARGRWQRSAETVDRARAGAAVLRLVDGGRSAGVVGLDGTTVRVDASDGQHWQATLPPAAAERLRAAAERLGR